MAPRRYDYNEYYYFAPTRPIETRDGIKARSQHGGFAKNWWAQRWIQSLERLMDPRRLTRGRNYARKGQVLSIEEINHGIAARVQGSRPTPYKITIQIAPFSDEQWERVIDALSEQAIFTAQLLVGEMPEEIEVVFQSAGVSLFPAKGGDLMTSCSCPDYVNPCKHIAATHYILGERFDEDPFLLFRLRGRDQEQVLQALRQRRAGQLEMPAETASEENEVIIPLENCMEKFWELSAPLEGFSVSIHPPSIEIPLLKRLGQAAFVPPPGIGPLLHPAYQMISRLALEAAFHEMNQEI
jgi:uncharacterized Zn finger protein